MTATFVCHSGQTEPPRCCSCPRGSECRDEDLVGAPCPGSCEWCTLGCKYPTIDGVEDPDGICCMELEPPPEDHPLHPQQMPMGWPRPLLGKLPVPYISERDDLGRVEKHRRHLVIITFRCQVCGEEPPDRRLIVVWRPGDAMVGDGAGVCQRCWPTSLRLCPHLHHGFLEGRLLCATVPIEQLVIAPAGLHAQVGGMYEGYLVPTW